MPSADTTRCTLPTTLPPFLSVKSVVWASIALPVPLSASGLPVIGWSLPRPRPRDSELYLRPDDP